MAEPVARKSLLRYSMEGGVWLGLYMVVRFAFTVLSSYSPVASIVALCLFAGTPVVLYYLMAHYCRTNGPVVFFSLLWMMGIMLFFFASLICSIPEYVFYRFIDPQYITNLFDQAFAILKENDLLGGTVTLDDLRKVLDEGGAPSPMQMILQSIWSNVFFGSLLSMVVALIVMVSHKRKKEK